MSVLDRLLSKIKYRIKLYIVFFKINYQELEVDGLDFLFGIVAKLLNYAAEILSLFFIFELVPEINGWDKYQVFFIFGLNLVGFSLWACFFINTITLPYYIQEGEFDRFLVRPLPTILQILLDGFDDDSWGELVTGLAILVYAWIKLHIGFWWIPLVILVAVSACFIYAGISILLSTVSFFTVAQSDVANFTMQIKEIAKYPMTIYPKALQFIFTFIFPVAFVAFFPMRVIMGDMSLVWVCLAPVIAGVFYWVSKKVWFIGLRHYGSSGT